MLMVLPAATISFLFSMISAQKMTLASEKTGEKASVPISNEFARQIAKVAPLLNGTRIESLNKENEKNDFMRNALAITIAVGVCLVCLLKFAMLITVIMILKALNRQANKNHRKKVVSPKRATKRRGKKQPKHESSRSSKKSSSGK